MVVFLDNKISFIFLFLINISLKGENIPKISKDDFLKSISNYEILVIGESNHGFGNHIQNRNNFVTELCENYGFDIVCLEGVGILDPIIYGNLLYKEKTKYFNKITNNNLFDVSDTTLLNYFSTRKNKILTGFDNTDVSLYDSLIVLENLRNLPKTKFCLQSQRDVNQIIIFCEKNNISNINNELLANYKKVLSSVLKIEFNSLSNNQKLFLKSFENYKVLSSEPKSNKVTLENIFYNGSQIREYQMFRNFSFLKDSVYKNKKIIIIASNLHSMKTGLLQSENGLNYITFGTYMKNKYNEKYAAIGSFTNGGYKGKYSTYSIFQFSRKNNILSPEILSETDSTENMEVIYDSLGLLNNINKIHPKSNDYLEYSLSKLEDSICYLDLSAYKGKKMKIDYFDISNLEYKNNLQWQKIFDFLIFYKTSKPKRVELYRIYEKFEKKNIPPPITPITESEYQKYLLKYSTPASPR